MVVRLVNIREMVYQSCLSFLWIFYIIFEPGKFMPLLLIDDWYCAIMRLCYLLIYSGARNICRFLPSCVSLLVIGLSNTLKYDFLMVWLCAFERTWWRFFQNRLVCTKFDFYVFISAAYIHFFLLSLTKCINNVYLKKY